MKFEVTTRFITKATSLQNQGIKVSKKSGVDFQKFVDKFLHEGENLKHFQNRYARLELPPPYALVILFVMHYFTLEGRYMSVHAYYFPLLNHIRHGERINLPFYLLSSLQLNIEKGASPPLHQGLMLSLYKYALSLNPHDSPYDQFLKSLYSCDAKNRGKRSF